MGIIYWGHKKKLWWGKDQLKPDIWGFGRKKNTEEGRGKPHQAFLKKLNCLVEIKPFRGTGL